MSDSGIEEEKEGKSEMWQERETLLKSGHKEGKATVVRQ